MAVAEKKSSSSKKTYESGLAPDRLLELLDLMVRIRRMEERSEQLYRQGKFAGFFHEYIGQEAVAVGTNAALRPEDHIVVPYRDHGWALVRGVPMVGIIGELLGRECGCAKGRGGSMHMFNKAANYHGGHGIVGAHIPLAAGVAFACKYRKENTVALVAMGDGAVPNGAFHEAANLAGVWRLPMIILVENNFYAMGTALKYTNAIADIYKRADGYGMKGLMCDGMDVESVHACLDEAAAAAREGTPVLVEARTYRFRGHSISDPATYRTKDEVEKYRARDPLTVLSERMIEAGDLTADAYKEMDKRAKAEAAAAAEEAEASPFPDPSTATDYVYSDPITPGADRG